MPAQFLSNFAAKANNALRQDPKRSALMGGLALVMGVLWARMLFNGPTSATAFIRRSVAAITDPSVLRERPASNNPVLDWLALPKRSVDRNLFAVHLDYYSKASRRNLQNGALEDPAKSTTDDADQNRDRQIAASDLQAQVERLKLQSTMMGPAPRAMINGELVKEGDSVDGFVVLKIEPRKVTVQQNQLALEIAMP